MLARWLSFSSTASISIAIACSSCSVWAGEPSPITSIPILTEAIYLSSEPVTLTQSALDNTTPNGISEVQSPSQPPPATEPNANTSTTPENRWQFSVEPYLFVPFDVDADITVRGRSASIEAGFSDIFHLDRIFAASLRLEARKNRLGFIIDGSYLSIGRDSNLDVTLPAEFLQRYGINTDVNVNADVSVDARQGVLDLAAFYRVVDTSLGKNNTEANTFPRLVVEPILGLRMNWLGQDIDISATRVGGIDIPDRDVELSAFFVEPMIGSRIGLELSERWAVGIRGDVSGFDINADRNITWNLFVGSQYRLSRTTALQLAYKLTKFDYQDGEGADRLGLDFQQQGLWLGLLFRF